MKNIIIISIVIVFISTIIGIGVYKPKCGPNPPSGGCNSNFKNLKNYLKGQIKRDPNLIY